MDSVLALLQAQPGLYVALVCAVGLCVGSFLNVVIHRLPKMLERQWQRECAELRGESVPETPRYNLILPASACPACNHRIRMRENVPVLSYLALGGKCAVCGHRISARYPAVELLSGVLTAYVGWHFGANWTAAAAMLFVWAMIALAFIDLDTLYLPDSITLPLLWAGLLAQLLTLLPQVGLTDGVIGAMAGYLTLWSVFWLFKLATGKEGMGYGDFKLLGAIGAWLGWKALPLVILLSSMVGAVIGIGLIVLRRRERDTPIPFGPYLVVAGLIALFWGRSLTERYLDLF
jgi:leader peptidase (prepilin peptidase)/N-methyltransferase